MRWLAGEPALQRELEPALLDPGGAGSRVSLLRERPGRRALFRVKLSGGGAVLVKRYVARPGLVERAKRGLGLEAARREWSQLRRLGRAGVAVPTPRALGRLPGGAAVLAVDHLDGRPLAEALGAAPAARRALLAAVGALVASLHAAGSVHGDLHAGNVWVTPNGPVLLDLQAARRSRVRRARRRDLGELDRSLAPSLSLADRVRLRARALGLERPFGAAARRELRAAGDATLARMRAHARSRRRRARRPGRRYAHLAVDGGRGLRLRRSAEGDLRAALGPAPGHELLRVREFRSNGWRGLLLDPLRGSPARRAWLAGHALRACGVDAALPVAYVEWRRHGLTRRSALVTEGAGTRLEPGGAAPEYAATEVRTALDFLRATLRAWGVRCASLRADAVWLERRGPRVRARLAEVDALRFGRAALRPARGSTGTSSTIPECVRRAPSRSAAPTPPPSAR